MNDIINKAAEVSMPKTSGKRNPRSVPWWSTEIYHVIKARKKALRALRRSNHNDPNYPALLTAFKAARAIATRKIKLAKRESWIRFQESISPDTNSATLWAKVRACSQNAGAQKVVLQIDGAISDDPYVNAEIFANLFETTSATSGYDESFQSSKRSVENEILPQIYENDEPYNNDISFYEFENALRSASGKAPGADGIQYIMLRKLPRKGKIALLETINHIWCTGSIPDEWKTGLTIPIPKGGKDRTKAESYRPITLLSCMGKLLEKIVNKRLMYELETKKLLSHKQHAFRAGRSAETYLIELEKLLHSSSLPGQHIDLVSLDISKAYDRTWRRPIITQLHEWGFDGRMVRYIRDFLSGRQFQVAVGQAKSASKIQQNGIPQGSPISVTLFLISMESMFEKIPPGVETLVYADDIVIVTKGTQPGINRRSTQKAVNAVAEWANSVGYKMSADKCCFMHLCCTKHWRTARKLELNGSVIPQSRKVKILGVVIDCKLNFKSHVRKIIMDLKPYLKVLRVIGGRFKLSNRQTLLKIMSSTIIPKICYGLELVSRGGLEGLQKLNPSLNEALRICTGAFRTSPIQALFAECGVLPLTHLLCENLCNKTIRWIQKNPSCDSNNTPLIARANEWFDVMTRETLPNIATFPEVIDKPWEQPTVRINFDVKNEVKAGCPSSVAVAHYKKVLNSRVWKTVIFTDGSKTDSVGFGVVAVPELTIVSGSLPTQCSIFSTEAYALVEAVEMINRLQDPFPAIVFSDSASCLDAIQGSITHPWIAKLRMKLEASDITLCWVPGHTGIAGNERADKAANDGRSQPKACDTVPASDGMKWVKQRLRAAWEREWHNCHGKLRSIKNTTTAWKDHFDPQCQRILTRLRIGHTWMTHKDLFSNRRSSPQCTTCGTNLSVQHLLLECRVYDDIRREVNLADSMNEILDNSRKSEKKLLNFVRKAKLTKVI